MGGSQSTRKITVVNDEASGVIKISDAVVQRLKGEIEAGPAAAGGAAAGPAAAPPPSSPPSGSSPAPSSSPPPVAGSVGGQGSPPGGGPPGPPEEMAAPLPPPSTTIEVPPAPPSSSSTTEGPPPPASHVWQRPIIQYIEEPSLSALRVRTEKEEELKQLETYWRERLTKQEAEHVNQAKLTEEEISKSANFVKGLFQSASMQGDQLCREATEAVQSCYSANPNKSLLCRDKVLEFSQCVHQARANLLTPVTSGW